MAARRPLVDAATVDVRNVRRSALPRRPRELRRSSGAAVENTDPRYVRSRLRLRTALLEIAHGDPSKLSVSAVCERTGIDRATFYRHFDTLDDLVADALADYADRSTREWESTAAGTGAQYAAHGRISFGPAETNSPVSASVGLTRPRRTHSPTTARSYPDSVPSPSPLTSPSTACTTQVPCDSGARPSRTSRIQAREFRVLVERSWRPGDLETWRPGGVRTCLKRDRSTLP